MKFYYSPNPVNFELVGKCRTEESHVEQMLFNVKEVMRTLLHIVTLSRTFVTEKGVIAEVIKGVGDKGQVMLHHSKKTLFFYRPEQIGCGCCHQPLSRSSRVLISWYEGRIRGKILARGSQGLIAASFLPVCPGAESTVCMDVARAATGKEAAR